MSSEDNDDWLLDQYVLEKCLHSITTGAIGDKTYFCLDCQQDVPNHEQYVDSGSLLAFDHAEVISNNIRQRREELGMTQQQLADRMLGKQPIISRYEKDYTGFTLITLHQLAQALETDLEALLNDSSLEVVPNADAKPKEEGS